jgi:hypothetical protein
VFWLVNENGELLPSAQSACRVGPAQNGEGIILGQGSAASPTLFQSCELTSAVTDVKI